MAGVRLIFIVTLLLPLIVGRLKERHVVIGKWATVEGVFIKGGERSVSGRVIKGYGATKVNDPADESSTIQGTFVRDQKRSVSGHVRKKYTDPADESSTYYQAILARTESAGWKRHWIAMNESSSELLHSINSIKSSDHVVQLAADNDSPFAYFRRCIFLYLCSYFLLHLAIFLCLEIS